ncbi:MAG TPA: aldehyde dehydrogenase family protein [Acidimicrobiales bacterium]|nr:aldehyde dehydrogenase family protein [Acidimicrobiales bacterium]
MTTVHQNFVGGEWIQGAEKSIDRNPSDVADVIGEYDRADVAQVAMAVIAAKEASVSWGNSSIQDRADILDRVGSALIERSSEFGEILSREEGKILRDGVGEVARAGRIFRFFAGEALRTAGQKLPSVRPGVEVEISREPLGVVGIITPWNFPFAIPAWKIAPALAYGNAVVFKPADLVPGSAWELAQLLAGSGLPAGVFNLVMGRGSVVGEAIITNPLVSAISFTGSVETGRHVAEVAAGRLAKIQLEMGGKNPLVILDDADLDVAVECAYQGSFEQTGQRCTASSRLIVTPGIHDKFLAALVERLKSARVDDALAPDSDIGPVIDESQLDQDLEYIRIGQQEGARLVCGGGLLDREKKGHYFEPALFADATNDMRISREEIFGPVASIIRAQDFDEALALANDTPYGLAAGIVTSSLKHASAFRRESQVGMVMVNLPTAGVDYHVPFGGRKGSSFGPREQGSYAAEFYTTVKTAYIKP